MATIRQIKAREILDARGFPTVEVLVELSDGNVATASNPSGTSKSTYEAFELRDNDPKRHMGMGVLQAVDLITHTLAPQFIGIEATNQKLLDQTLISMDGTLTKAKLGANTTMPLSMAFAKAGAKSQSTPLFLYLRNFLAKENVPLRIPTPAMNMVNGGKHAGNNINFQEFLVIPATSQSYSNSLMMGVTVYNSLRSQLKKGSLTTTVGDEGGFAPNFENNVDAFDFISQAISSAAFRLGYDIFIGLDASAKNFFQDQEYKIKDKESPMNSNELITFYEEIVKKYHLIYLEDPLSEEDWQGWSTLSMRLSNKALLVGDDLTATNPFRLQLALNNNSINGLVIKPGQIGTVLESLAVVEMGRHAGLKLIVSHRNSETNDDFLADYSVAIGADYAKFGAPARGECVAKYNRLLEIEQLLLNSSQAL